MGITSDTSSALKVDKPQFNDPPFVTLFYLSYIASSLFDLARVANMAAKTPLPNDNVAHALAGAGGGLLSMVLTYPLITLSTRAQVESKKAESKFIEAVQRIVAREGVSGLYSGINSALFGISVTNFVYYYWYEWTRAFFEKAAIKAGRASSKLTTIESMIAGALAGSATVIITNPILQYTLFEQMKNAVEKRRKVTPAVAFFL